ncbi:MAG: putative alpha/beta hydrolase [Cyclobacteriaceae bacterium]|jgi:predicted alpha/beta hydrolase
MTQAEPLEITTQDHFKIHAIRYWSNDSKKKHLVIIVPANGAPQGYYRSFAEYVSADDHFDSLTFDYRGIGKSLDVEVKESEAKLDDWGKEDLTSVIDWADDKYDKIFVLGHSIAGQIFPLALNTGRISASYFVASSSAYKGNWKGIHYIGILVFWYLLLPLFTFFKGYMPGWVMGGDISLPKNVALQWRKAGIHKNGIIGNDQVKAEGYSSIKIPVHFLSIDDDKMYAPTKAVQALMRQYINAKTTFQFIRPIDLGYKEIGHFGFFRRKNQHNLWYMPIMFFTQFVEKLDQ